MGKEITATTAINRRVRRFTLLRDRRCAQTPSPVSVPWLRYTVPDGEFLRRAESWQAERLFGQPQDAAVTLDKAQDPLALRLAARFTNTDPAEPLAGDAVRFMHRGQWDLEPFGRGGPWP